MIRDCVKFNPETGKTSFFIPPGYSLKTFKPRLKNTIDEYVLSSITLLHFDRWKKIPSNRQQYCHYTWLTSKDISKRSRYEQRQIYTPLNRLVDHGMLATRYNETQLARGMQQQWSLNDTGLHYRVMTLLSHEISTVITSAAVESSI